MITMSKWESFKDSELKFNQIISYIKEIKTNELEINSYTPDPLRGIAYAMCKNYNEFNKYFDKLNSENPDPFKHLQKRIIVLTAILKEEETFFSFSENGSVFAIKVYYDISSRVKHAGDVYSGLKKIGELYEYSYEMIDGYHVSCYHSSLTSTPYNIWINRGEESPFFVGLPSANLPSYTTSPFEVKKSHDTEITIIIPVYGRHDLLQKLLNSIFSGEEIDSIKEIIIADDDQKNDLKNIEEITNKFPPIFKIIKNKENLGFLKNCNNAFSYSSSKLVILINSDVTVPKKWISRITAPFSDEHVALATPLSTNGENLTLSIPTGYTWRTVDSIISKNPPLYPSASTAIGYCLAIRRNVIEGLLFDEQFEHGYGEDSDLHFRLTKLGYASVVVDNLLVLHDHGASYSNHETLDRDLMRHKNHLTFMAKWKEAYMQENEIFEKNKNAWFPKIFNNKHEAAVFDIVFLVPSPDRRYGGIKVIFDIADKLIEEDFKVAIIIDGDGSRHIELPNTSINPFPSIKYFLKETFSTNFIISSSFDTIPSAECIKNSIGGLHINLVQGPEALFSGGLYFNLYSKLIKTPDSLLSVSSYLENFCDKYFSVKAPSINYGPSKLTFYDKNKNRNQKAVAISLNNTAEKGTAYTLLAAKKMHERGLKIISFGNWDGEVPNFIEHLGWLTEQKIANLFNTVGFYFESSFYEGLGLLSLEATLCGAIPVARKNGAVEKIFGSDLDPYLWSDFSEVDDIIEKISSINHIERIKTVKSLNKKASLYDLETGFLNFLNKIKGV